MATPLRVASGNSSYIKSLPKSRRQYGTAPMPDFIEPQLAKLVDEPPRGAQWVHEMKFDGYRIQARIENGKCLLRSRKGLDYTRKFSEIADACSELPDCIIDGEVCALDKNGLPDFAALQQAMKEGKTGKLVFFVFDLLWEGREDRRSYALADRKIVLERLLGELDSSRVRYVEHMEASGAAMFESACRMGLEGIVSKNLDRTYRAGERSDNWLKTKCRKAEEVVIGGWEMNGGRLARLFMGCYSGGKFTYIGNAGTGFNERNAPGIMKRLRALEVPKMPFEANQPSKARDKHWCRPEMVCEVEYEEWTASGKMRQASFKRLRDDKDAEEIVIERRIGREVA